MMVHRGTIISLFRFCLGAFSTIGLLFPIFQAFQSRSDTVDHKPEKPPWFTAISMPGPPAGPGSRFMVQIKWGIAGPPLLAQARKSKDCAVFTLQGTIRGGSTDRFLYRFYPGEAALLRKKVWFAFERELPEGAYRIQLTLIDCAGETLAASEHPIEVSGQATKTGDLTGVDREKDSIPNFPLLIHGLILQLPDQPMHVDLLPVEAFTVGEGIAEVRFYLDGRRIDAVKKPPYRTMLRLPSAPVMMELHAEALDDRGLVLARERLTLNAGSNSFSIRLVEPVEGRTYHSSLRARARVEVPSGHQLDRVDFFLNDQKVSTLYQPPYSVPMLLPEDDGASHVRAVAYLRDGREADDLIVVNTPGIIEGLEVRQVNLWVTVLDGESKPVTGLQPSAFQVFENDEPQEVLYMEEAADVPVHLVFLVDVSRSVAFRIPSIVGGAKGMMRRLIGPDDRGAVMVFQDHARLLMPFTSDPKHLKDGLDRIVDEALDNKPRGSGIYDSIAYALHYFGGVKGRKALVIYTDSLDNSSQFGMEEMLQIAKRANVRIYIVSEPYRERPEILYAVAKESGGSLFVARNSGNLKRALRKIDEEIRSLYLVRYQSTTPSWDRDCRLVKIRFIRPDLKARTIEEYCP